MADEVLTAAGQGKDCVVASLPHAFAHDAPGHASESKNITFSLATIIKMYCQDCFAASQLTICLP